jgi:hypothetical protein
VLASSKSAPLHYKLLIIIELKKPDSRGGQESTEDAKNKNDSGQFDVSSFARTAVAPSDTSDNVLKLPRLTAVLEIADGKSQDIDEESENGDEESLRGKALKYRCI